MPTAPLPLCRPGAGTGPLTSISRWSHGGTEGSSGGLEEDVCEVLSVVLPLIITGSVNTGELSVQALVVLREVAGWVGFGEPCGGRVGGAE